MSRVKKEDIQTTFMGSGEMLTEENKYGILSKHTHS